MCVKDNHIEFPATFQVFIPQGAANLKLRNFTDRILSSFVTGGTFPELYTYYTMMGQE